MNLFGAWKKLLLFGLFGAAGCLAGWAIGEPYLAVAQWLAASAGAEQGPSLISSSPANPTEPPPLPTEFRERVERAGGHTTGDVQISLIWFNTNDLDLHCIDPRNVDICYKRKQSPSGGELDVDKNAGCNADRLTAEPVENIYWAKGTAPMGHYQVYVDYFQQCTLGPDETRYKVNVLHGNERKEFSGTITKAHTGPERKLIYEFKLAPLVEVLAPHEFQLHCGTLIRVPVAVRRSFYSGKLELEAENLPAGVSASPVEISAGKSEGVIELRASSTALAGTKAPIKLVAVSTETPDVHGSADLQMELLEPAFSPLAAMMIGIWTALLAVGLCLALVVGQNRYLGRPPLARGRVPLSLMITGAAIAGFLSGSVGQSLFAFLLSSGVGSLGFLVGWVLLGGLLGVGVSYFVPNLDRKKAMIAGLVGGLLGAAGYLIGSHAAEWLGRFAGAAMLGFCIGLMVAIVEAAFRRAWLEVRYGERETISVNLGPEPVKVGGDARACTIWARGAADVALRYFVRDGRVVCEDAPSRSEAIAGNGATRTLGTLTLIVHTGGGEAAPVRTRPSSNVLPRPTRAIPAAPATAAPVAAPPASPPVAKPLPAAKPPEASPRPAPAARPVVPPPPKPVPAATPPAPAASIPAPPRPPIGGKPPVPTAAPKAVSPRPLAPEVSAAKTTAPEACPTCGRKAPGRPGSRFCMVCEKSY